MTKEGLEYISNFIGNMLCDESIIRILKQNYALKVTKEDNDNFIIPKNVKSFYCDYAGGRMIKAYEPFLDIIRECIFENNLDIDKVLDDADVYSLNRSSFKSYITAGEAKRAENPILAERDYDRQKFVEGVINLMLYLSEIHPIFIILNEANQMGDSTLTVLKELLEKSSKNLKILIISNEMGNIKGYISEAYNNFIRQSDMKGIVSDWPFQSFEEELEIENTFVFENTKDELKQIRTMYYTFAYEQANYYLGMIYQKVELDKVDVSTEFRIDMLTMYIMVSVVKENYSYALILCERLNRINAHEQEKRKQYLYYYYKATANMYIGNEDDAKKNAKLCYDMAIEIGEIYDKFQAMILMNMSELGGWKDIWICDKPIEITDELINLCYKYNYLNHLAHIYVYCFDNDYKLYTVVEGIEERTPNVTKGIWLANKLKNDQFLVEAYRKNIMVASCNGLFQTASYFYTKSIEVVKRNNDRFEEANIYNGLGFNCCTSDKYSEANRYYNRALKIFYEKKDSDYIMETLYNMGTNAILAGDYIHATEYLITVNNILKMLKKNSLRVCNISKIFGLIALSSFKQGNYYTAQVYTNKSENFLRYILDYREDEFYSYLWDDDMFLFFYVSALIADRNGKYDDALANYDKAEVYMSRGIGSKFFTYVHFAVDKSKLLAKIGRIEESRNLLNEARLYFNSKGNFLRVKMFDDLIGTGRWEYPPMQMMLTDISIDEIMNFIRTESIEHEAKAKRQQIRFFGTFQELVNHSYESVEKEIDTLITNFKNNFNLDNMLFVSYENEFPEIKYNDLEYPISSEEINTLVEFFKNNANGFALSKFSNNYHIYEKILKIFDKSKVFSIIGAPVYQFEKLHSFFITFVKIPESWNCVINREVLDEDDLEMYLLVFRQILDAIEKYKLNEKLIKQAITDELTGLLNRKGYYEIIDNTLKTALSNNEKLSCSFMYLDLDHFKYYNDTFGHNVGDAILKKFAQIFTEACGDNGYVVRFGGDEFVMLLNTTDVAVLDNISRKIYELIENEDGFVSLVERYRKEEVSIPSSFRATCSIGVDIGRDMTKFSEVSEMQKHADSALYFVKKNGRGRMKIF